MISGSLAVILFVNIGAAARAEDPDSKGIVLLAEGRYQEAAALFDRSLRKDKDNPRAYANRCTARYKLKDWEGAISDFEAAVRLKPKLKASLAPAMSDAYYRRARYRIDHGSQTAATEDLYASVRLDRKNALAYSELGFLAVANGQYDTAVPYFDRAVKLAPDMAPAYASRAAALMALGRGGEAFADMDRAILIDPENGSYFASRARVAESIGRRGQAVKDARRAVELDASQAGSLKPILDAVK